MISPVDGAATVELIAEPRLDVRAGEVVASLREAMPEAESPLSKLRSLCQQVGAVSRAVLTEHQAGGVPDHAHEQHRALVAVLRQMADVSDLLILDVDERSDEIHEQYTDIFRQLEQDLGTASSAYTAALVVDGSSPA